MIRIVRVIRVMRAPTSCHVHHDCPPGRVREKINRRDEYIARDPCCDPDRVAKCLRSLESVPSSTSGPSICPPTEGIK